VQEHKTTGVGRKRAGSPDPGRGMEGLRGGVSAGYSLQPPKAAVVALMCKCLAVQVAACVSRAQVCAAVDSTTVDLVSGLGCVCWRWEKELYSLFVCLWQLLCCLVQLCTAVLGSPVCMLVMVSEQGL
jgi:hypothetical protein